MDASENLKLRDFARDLATGVLGELLWGGAEMIKKLISNFSSIRCKGTAEAQQTSMTKRGYSLVGIRIRL